MNSYYFIELFQEYLHYFDAWLRFVSAYGTYYAVFMFALIIFLTGFNRIGAKLAIGIAISSMVVGSCRHLFPSPRPYWLRPDLFNQSILNVYGMPSGHAQINSLLWGLIAVHANRLWLWIIAIFMILSVCISRLYLGVHFVDQVLTGLAIGLVIVFTVHKLENCLTVFFQSPAHYLKKIALIIALCFLPLLISVLICELWGHHEDRRPENYVKMVKFTSILLGSCIGIVFAPKVKYSWFYFITRAIPGALLVMLFWRLLPEFNEWASHLPFYYTMSFLKYWAIALFGAFLWPWIYYYASKSNVLSSLKNKA